MISKPSLEWVGYFTFPGQTVPEHDPGKSAPCPVCEQPLGNEHIKTISLAAEGPAFASFFFRAHKVCWERAPEEIREIIEGEIIDFSVSGKR